MTRTSPHGANAAPGGPRIVLAYSGSAATASGVRWLADRYGADVVTLTLDLGQGKPLEAVRDRALSLGAVRAHVLDVHDQFVREYLLRALRAGALYDGDRSLVRALSRPLIAQRLVEVARIEQTTDVAHACAAGDDRVFAAVRSLDAGVQVIAVPRDAARDGVQARQMPAAPAEPAFVDLAFDRGHPVAINAIPMPPLDLIASLDIIARAHALADALRVLSAAHQRLQQTTAPAAADELRRQYVTMIDRGDWFAPARQTLDSAVAKVQDRVSGIVRLKLFQGGCEIVSCQPTKSPKHLTVIA
jgi:argininosuccinate synthase